jgi:hypothetical protein
MRGREGRKRDDLHLVIKFLQNMEETFLSSKIPMNHSFNPKGTYKIFFPLDSIPPFLPLQFLSLFQRRPQWFPGFLRCSFIKILAECPCVGESIAIGQ